MLNQPIEISTPPSQFARICFVISVMLLFVALILKSMHLTILAVVPLTMAIAFRRKSSRDTLVLDETKLTFYNSGFEIPYADLRWISMNGTIITNTASVIEEGPIGIGFADRQIQLPMQLSIPETRLVNFLVERIPPTRVSPHAPTLVEYWNKQCSLFGVDKVTVINARTVAHLKRPANAGTRFGLALFCSGIICLGMSIGTSIDNPFDELYAYWFGFSVAAIAAGLIIAIVGASSDHKSRTRLATMRGACIIISPAGLAMEQGTLKGVLRWDEITGLNSGSAGSFRPRDSALQIAILGGSIGVLDVYETSLVQIASLIRKNLGIKT